ncbi:MAG: pseudouridine synthase [Weeksellaceae bacterium]
MKSGFKNKITYFDTEQISGIQLPEKFNYPHYYEPHPLCKLAADELKEYISNHFGSEKDFTTGKMFGVLIVRDPDNQIGYLSAFSGKLMDSNHYEKFVPPVFDMLDKDGFFKKGEQKLNRYNHEIETLENHSGFIDLKNELEKYLTESEKEISGFKKQMKENKAKRKSVRETEKSVLSEEEYLELEKELFRQSNYDQFRFKILKRSWKTEIERLENEIQSFQNQIDALKNLRKQKSNQLQNQLFEQYSFLNKDKEEKRPGAIFSETVFEKPPSGAGECATPKLLQFAFKNELQPIAFAEFWYGASPESEIRKHGHFYPACSGKCRPILKHMLKGTAVEENPILNDLAKEKQLKIIFEDDFIVVVNKPENLLSVPGIEIQDSVYSRLQEKMKDCEPLIVHRLDMSTSGLMVVAKTKEAHKNLQQQFLKQTVTKRYTALLDGIPKNEEGEINLPLKPDILDRPRQKVDFEKGKKSKTIYKVFEKRENRALIHYWPVTGRTHQLRVHSAHSKGLNCPILGDELYGTPGKILCLHAGFLEFNHPGNGERICFEMQEDFD